MPAVPASSFILLTGASGTSSAIVISIAARPNNASLLSHLIGFLAAHCGQQFLQKGYRVRGTVRSIAKGEYLKSLYAKQGLSKFEYVIVEDVEGAGAFDEAVKGVDGVAHTASPFHFNVTDPYKDLINPAVNGTLNLLKSALLEPKIQRVVITSSYAAILNPVEPVYQFDEKDWNTYSLEQVERLGNKVDGGQAYRASKTLAERAAWKFIEEHTVNGVAPFDISTINPPLIFGPLLHEIASASALNTSVGAFYAYLTGAKTDKDATAASGCYVDVRDVARLHVESLEVEKAGGKRFAVSHESFSYQPFLDLLHSPAHADLIKAFPKTVKGIPGTSPAPQNNLNAGRAKEIFRWTPITMEKTIVDMTESLAEYQKKW